MFPNLKNRQRKHGTEWKRAHRPQRNEGQGGAQTTCVCEKNIRETQRPHRQEKVSIPL